MTDDLPAVDVIVPLRNEAHNIPRFVDMLVSQTLAPARVIVADGMSEDDSRLLLQQASSRIPNLVIVDNAKRGVPSALNKCLDEVTAPLVARMDMHAEYAPEYLRSVVTVLASDDQVVGVGGLMDTQGRGQWGKAIASTLRRPIGLGGARHRVGGRAGHIGHVFSGCYRTAALREIGGWDESFPANEDFEADTRLRREGGKLWLTHEAKSTWFVRESPPLLAKQMWRYGYQKGHTLARHPDALRLRQLAPPAMILGIGLLAYSDRLLAARATGAYVMLAMGAGAVAAASDGASPVRGACVPPLVHLAWGGGLLAGLVRYGLPRAFLVATTKEHPGENVR